MVFDQWLNCKERLMSGDARAGAGSGFGARVAEAVSKTGPLCAGIDPSSSLVKEWGLPDTADGLLEFGIRCVDAFAGTVPVVKPQVAFFERMGAAGMGALETVIRRARAAGLLVIADAKRGDIGSTSAAYASAWLDPSSPLASDAMTGVAYMGLGAIRPMIDMAQAHGNGVIVVVRSSNPEGQTLQAAADSEGRSIADGLLADIAARNTATPGVIGAVIGATLHPSEFSLPELGGPILAPGVGAQGGTAADIAALFKGCPSGSILPGVSRSVLAVGPDVDALRRAALAVRDEMAEALRG
jgi:orotidine-5'-phosphate decarboxylase